MTNKNTLDNYTNVNFSKIFHLFLLPLLFTYSSAFAQNLEIKVDSIILSELKDAKGPGGVFLIAQDGKVIYQKAFCKANLELI